MARKTENALQKWEYPKKSGIHIRQILNATGGDAFGASYMVTVPAKLTGKFRARKQFARREDAEDWADKTFLGYRKQGEDFFALTESAAYLACSPRKLRDLVAARRVKHARVGAKIVIRRDWLDAFLGT